MNYSEFKRWLGAEPRSSDPEFERARDSAPEFRQAAAEAEHFEGLLERAMDLPAPEGLIEDLQAIEKSAGSPASRRWLPMAMAASLLLAVGAAGITWKMNRSWDSVEDYLVDHYRHDGEQMVEQAGIAPAKDVEAILAALDVSASPELAGIINVIKYCPTPDAKGVHMVLNTESGPVTLIYMPETSVNDQEALSFDSVEALLVDLPRGSAAIIGPDRQRIAGLYTMVHDSFLPKPEKS